MFDNPVEYIQGMTKIWSDGEKVIITNPTGDKHVEENIAWVFGLGVFQKMDKVKYSSSLKNGRNYEMVTGFIPDKIINDLKEKNTTNLDKLKELRQKLDA